MALEQDKSVEIIFGDNISDRILRIDAIRWKTGRSRGQQGTRWFYGGVSGLMEGAGRDKVILGSGTRQRHVRTRGSRARDHTEQILASRMSHFHSTVSSSCRCHRSTESLYTRFFHDPVRRPSSFPSSSLPRPRQPKGTDHDLVFATPIRAGSPLTTSYSTP